MSVNRTIGPLVKSISSTLFKYFLMSNDEKTMWDSSLHECSAVALYLHVTEHGEQGYTSSVQKRMFQPCHEKTCFLHMQKQKFRSAGW